MTIPVKTLMAIPAHVLINTIPAKELKTIPANELMMTMIYYKLQLVTCNHLQLAKNTMLIIMIIHYVKWFMDQCMCHIMETARS